MHLDKYDNRWYSPGRHKLICLLWYFINAVFFSNSFFPFSAFKVWLLRVFGCEVGVGVVIKPNVNIKYPWNIQIGDHVWIGEAVWLDSLAAIHIGNHVCISQGAYLLTGNHHYKKESFDLIVQPIVLEDSVWIGAKAVVCPGVHCGKSAILAVGSIASGNLESNWVYRGNPAEKVRLRYV